MLYQITFTSTGETIFVRGLVELEKALAKYARLNIAVTYRVVFE